MTDFFIAGGFGMYPTLLAGLCLLATCVQYARRPERRFVPLMLALGLFTLLAGGLGFITGLGSLLSYLASPAAPVGNTALLLGLREALNNIVLALMLTSLAVLFAAVGAYRLSRQLTLAPAAAR
ncbi:hypothetical protein P2318_18055 [Myxococcaceae bacterium GXIMD 01537]